MKIKYLGHAAFELDLDSGRRIVFDPYTTGAFDAIDYAPIEGKFDAAVVSHDHDDHCCRDVLSRAKRIINKAGRVDIGGASIESAATFHDEAKGAKRGKNLVSVVEAEGLRVAHLGDLGHSVTAKDVPILKGVDVMMIPVGGYFTIDAAAAAKIVKELGPKIVIPMHYLTMKVTLPISPVENFTKLMDNVERAGASEIAVTKETLPATTKVIVLEAAN
ncbi:MAG: MBL fold metallo-hydrolase [Candidatus Krumholzibacteria bacterium]|nr:MBL fold metallo-hydrolase [Candidatus Krumholzibacteria bacterium]